MTGELSVPEEIPCELREVRILRKGNKAQRIDASMSGKKMEERR